MQKHESLPTSASPDPGQTAHESIPTSRVAPTYGVFVWSGGRGYSLCDVIKVYRNRAAAEKFAYKNLQYNYVVRELRLIVRGTLPEGV